jgi:hypothetical protein
VEVTSTKIDNMDAVAVEVPQEVPILVAAILIVDQDRQRRRQQRREEEERRRRAARTPRRWWVRPWLLQRREHRWYNCLMQQMELEDPESFRKMLRVEPDMFYELQEQLSDSLHRRSARQSISVGLQLAVTQVPHHRCGLWHFHAGLLGVLQYLLHDCQEGVQGHH